MWGQGEAAGFGGGGFMANATDSPAASEKQGKARRSQNIIPVTVKQLLECQEDAVKIEGSEAHVITIVGLVRAVETTTTKMSMYIEDQTGTIECLNYVGSEGDNNSEPSILCEGTYGRIVGALRSMKGQKYVIIFKSDPITDLNEVTSHLLEVLQTPLNLKKLRAAEINKPVGGGALDNTFSNSMIKGGIGGATNMGGTPEGGIQGFTPHQNLVYRVITRARDETGLHRDQIIAAVKNEVPLKELTEILEFLSNEGHVFSTVDDDHYKSTDSQYT